MDSGVDPAPFVGLAPDEKLLADDLSALPASVGRPEPLPESSARRVLVGAGATLTGLTLIGGIALVILAVVLAAVDSVSILAAALIVLGTILVATHWGWVHVAELSANALVNSRSRALVERRQLWLATIEPYTRWEVATRTAEDGSITIQTVCYRPVRRGEGSFSFVPEVEAQEAHAGEEPAAAVAERAELLRREAAARTERERERYATANDAYQSALLAHADEQERRAAVRAASAALSEQINANLRDPPLSE